MLVLSNNDTITLHDYVQSEQQRYFSLLSL